MIFNVTLNAELTKCLSVEAESEEAASKIAIDRFAKESNLNEAEYELNLVMTDYGQSNLS